MKQIPIQVHDYKTRYGNALRSLKSSGLPEQDIEDVISFVHYCAAEQVSIARQVKCLVQVKVAALRLQRLGSSLRAASKTIRLVNSTVVSVECL